jgi:hypothetical protein
LITGVKKFYGMLSRVEHLKIKNGFFNPKRISPFYHFSEQIAFSRVGG